MENRAYAVAAGLFVLLLAAAAIAGAVWFTGGTFQGVPYDLVSSTSVAGLGRGAPVRLRGVDVGKVDSIDFDPQDPRRVLVRISVDPKVRLMQDAYANLSYLGISGTAYVELDYPDDSHVPSTQSLAAHARIPMRPAWLPQLADSAGALMKTASTTLERLDAVLSQENAAHLSQLLAQLDAGAAQVTALAGELRPAARRLDGLVADTDQAIRSTRPVLRNFDGLVSDARARIGALDALQDGMRDTGQAARSVERALVRDTLPRVNALMQQLTRDADTLNAVLQEIKDQPQSLIFGAAPRPPGPGEPGFQAAPPARISRTAAPR